MVVLSRDLDQNIEGALLLAIWDDGTVLRRSQDQFAVADLVELRADKDSVAEICEWSIQHSSTLTSIDWGAPDGVNIEILVRQDDVILYFVAHHEAWMPDWRTS